VITGTSPNPVRCSCSLHLQPEQPHSNPNSPAPRAQHQWKLRARAGRQSALLARAARGQWCWAGAAGGGGQPGNRRQGRIPAFRPAPLAAFQASLRPPRSRPAQTKRTQKKTACTARLEGALFVTACAGRGGWLGPLTVQGEVSSIGRRLKGSWVLISFPVDSKQFYGGDSSVSQSQGQGWAGGLQVLQCRGLIPSPGVLPIQGAPLGAPALVLR
jgi:hypothetical protein